MISTLSISGNDFSMSTAALKVMSSDRTTFLYYAVYTNYEWYNQKPSWRLGKDGITVNWDNSLLYYMANSFYCKNYYQTSGTKYTYSNTSTPDEVNQGGIGITFDLHNDEMTYLSGTVFFRLSSDQYGSGRSTTINSVYAHSLISIPTLSVGFSGFGVAFSQSAGRDFSSSSDTIYLG
ncbi:MAG: hypothetical protein VB023_02360 [Oscillibacter sp.]|nr:hypothetical protein [Oscillibacter sp.]